MRGPPELATTHRRTPQWLPDLTVDRPHPNNKTLDRGNRT